MNDDKKVIISEDQTQETIEELTNGKGDDEDE